MSPERTSANGRFRTDWQRKEIGRIRVTWGKTEKEHARAVQLLDELYDNEQYDVLRALKKKRNDPGRVEVGELLAARKAGRHKRDDVLVDLKLRRPLWSTLEAMAAARPGGDAHRAVTASMFRSFARSSAGAQLGPDAIVADLRELDWRALRKEFGAADTWNNLRKAIGAALASLLGGPDHPFRKALMKQIPREKATPREVDISVEQFWQLVGAMPEVFQAPIVTLAVTGMRLETEYLRCTAAAKRKAIHGVYCPGSKTADATGIIPVAPALWDWVDVGIPAPRKMKQLRAQFHRAAVTVGLGQYVDTGKTRVVKVRKRDRAMTDELRASGAKAPARPRVVVEERPVLRYTGIRLHDLRHLALQLAVDGGAAINDVQSLARHADPAMTMRYLTRGGRKRAADAIGRMLVPEAKKA